MSKQDGFIAEDTHRGAQRVYKIIQCNTKYYKILQNTTKYYKILQNNTK